MDNPDQHLAQHSERRQGQTKQKTQHRKLKMDPIRRLGEFIYYQDDVVAIMLFVFTTHRSCKLYDLIIGNSAFMYQIHHIPIKLFLQHLRQNLKLFPILIQYRMSTTINIGDYY